MLFFLVKRVNKFSLQINLAKLKLCKKFKIEANQRRHKKGSKLSPLTLFIKKSESSFFQLQLQLHHHSHHLFFAFRFFHSLVDVPGSINVKDCEGL